jgi:hypothetical protein
MNSLCVYAIIHIRLIYITFPDLCSCTCMVQSIRQPCKPILLDSFTGPGPQLCRLCGPHRAPNFWGPKIFGFPSYRVNFNYESGRSIRGAPISSFQRRKSSGALPRSGAVCLTGRAHLLPMAVSACQNGSLLLFKFFFLRTLCYEYDLWLFLNEFLKWNKFRNWNKF